MKIQAFCIRQLFYCIYGCFIKTAICYQAIQQVEVYYLIYICTP